MILRTLGVAALAYYLVKKRTQKKRLNTNRVNTFDQARSQRPIDKVDEASWESFPASDPPSF